MPQKSPPIVFGGLFHLLLAGDSAIISDDNNLGHDFSFIDSYWRQTESNDALARRWIVRFARQRGGKSMSEKLAFEILDASQNTGGAVKRKEETHRMAESNKAFSHFRY